MRHIRHRIKASRTVCGARVADKSDLVTAALESDCNNCRVAIGIARMNDKMYGGKEVGIREHPQYETKPYPNIEPKEK